MFRVLAFLVLLAGAPAFAAETAPDVLPKLGPKATSIFSEHTYLRVGPAPDYWQLSPFYLPQQGDSDCSLAAAAMAMNALRGLPPDAGTPLVTADSLLTAVANADWTTEAADGGPGVTFEAFAGYLQESLAAEDLANATMEAAQLSDDAAGLAALRALLAVNEQSADDVMLVYFNQGVITGDWDGPHISPIGAYDAAADRVLIMDVDRTWYVPYWTDTATLLAAMTRPTPAEYGPLADGLGGYYLLKRGLR